MTDEYKFNNNRLYRAFEFYHVRIAYYFVPEKNQDTSCQTYKP
jgi:hypothetical protein